MDSVEEARIKSKGGIGRTFSKMFSNRSLKGIAPDNVDHKIKLDNFKNNTQPQLIHEDEKIAVTVTEAVLAKLFASLSAVKAAYSQLQSAESPYNPDGIQSADKILIYELKKLSQIKHCFYNNQLEASPETTITLAEIQEHKSSIKLYEIMANKLDSDVKLKDTEITFLKHKLEDANEQNRLLEKRLNSSGQIQVVDSIRLSNLSTRHFISFVRQGTNSIKSFVRMLTNEMESADWDLDVAAKSIEPDVVYWNSRHRCYTFESFVCREMFYGFNHPEFSLSTKPSSSSSSSSKQLFFDRFMELKSVKPMDYLAWKPNSLFSTFCRAKYLRLIHPKMESSFFGNLDQRNLVKTGEFPETTFFITFAKMAKHIWLLHSLGFSFEPEASVFQVSKGSRFSEVYMESVNEEGLISSKREPHVGFTVVPGFRVAKTVVQSQVYLS